MVEDESNGSWGLRFCCESTVVTWTEAAEDLRTLSAGESGEVNSAIRLDAPGQE